MKIKNKKKKSRLEFFRGKAEADKELQRLLNQKNKAS
jgi:hypothetical protein